MTAEPPSNAAKRHDILSLTTDDLTNEFRSLWNCNHRKTTLQKIAVHKRQFEAWWKFEVATHLWELAEHCEVYVWVEVDARADIVLGSGIEDKPYRLDRQEPRIPIELKTTGTWWANPTKALCERGKKSLVADMDDARKRVRKGVRPFAVVALLITHHANEPTEKYSAFCEKARALGEERKLERILNEAVPLDPEQAEAWQLMWVARAP